MFNGNDRNISKIKRHSSASGKFPPMILLCAEAGERGGRGFPFDPNLIQTGVDRKSQKMGKSQLRAQGWGEEIFRGSSYLRRRGIFLTRGCSTEMGKKNSQDERNSFPREINLYVLPERGIPL